VKGQSKSDHLMYGESLMTHAMVLTAVGLRKRIRQSGVLKTHGTRRVGKAVGGDWFTECLMEIVVDKKFLSPEMLEVLNQQVKVLPAWNPS